MIPLNEFRARGLGISGVGKIGSLRLVSQKQWRGGLLFSGLEQIFGLADLQKSMPGRNKAGRDKTNLLSERRHSVASLETCDYHGGLDAKEGLPAAFPAGKQSLPMT